MILKKIHNSISLKLIIAISFLVVAGWLIAWYIVYYISQKDMINTTVTTTMTYIDIIQKSLHYYMLKNQRETIEKIVDIAGKGEGVERLRILDLKGNIKFSSFRNELGNSISNDTVTCKKCHETEGESKKWIITHKPNGEKFLKVLMAVKNEKSCYTAQCHFHSEDKKVNGIIELDYSLSHIYKKAKGRNLAAAAFGIISLILISATLFLILWRIIVNPISSLSEGMGIISKGNLDHKVKINSKDEIGMLAKAFNSMTNEIKSSREKLENWTKTLEECVAEKTEEMKKAQQQYIRTEKLASLGRMAAGVAHELNSPLTGIVTFAHLLLNRIPPENEMDREDLNVIIEQAERCSSIITGLLRFSRSIPSEKEKIDINKTIDHTHDILREQSKFHNISIVMNLDTSLPKINGDSSQIEQVFINLIINAADAMNDQGKIIIETGRIMDNEKEFIEIRVTDTGPGIPEEDMSRLFEPFFTTKPVGQGTGLGLSVSHGIIHKFGGHILVMNNPDMGACFIIRLPIPNEKDNSAYSK